MPRSQRNAFLYPSVLTAVLAIVLIAETIGFSLYTYADVQREIAPENLADKVEETVRKRYPAIREQIAADLKQNAPAIAKQASEKLVESAPEMRQWLEKVTARQLQYGLEKGTQLSADQFRVFLRENHDQVEQALVQLEQAPEEARKLVRELESELDKQYGLDVRNDAKQALAMHRTLNDKLERLNSDAPLEPKELLERRIVRILRTLQQQQMREIGLARLDEAEASSGF
ncbi:MAG: hypothetical protein RIC55_34700 [Pirellulaceae bacterium]